MNNTEEYNCSICKAERLGNAQKYIDWDKPLRITTHNGTFKVYNLGIGWKDKRLVQIEECSARFPSHDGGLPNVFAPDESGYVVQFDTWIENEPVYCETVREELKGKSIINSEMTREEAIKLLIDDVWNNVDNGYAEKWIDVWEKLGIVKFKEKTTYDKLMNDNELKKRREMFRSNLADVGLSAHTLYSSPVLKAFDDAFNLREPSE